MIILLACSLPTAPESADSGPPDVDCDSTYPALVAEFSARGAWVASMGCPFEGDTAANLIAKECESYERFDICYECGISAYIDAFVEGGCAQ